MSRMLIIFLMFIFPFQVTLAAADLCCGYAVQKQHESCTQSEAASAVEEPVRTGSGIDVHCATCVFASAGYMHQQLASVPKPAAERVAREAAIPFLFASHLAPRPERPQWLRTA